MSDHKLVKDLFQEIQETNQDDIKNELIVYRFPIAFILYMLLINIFSFIYPNIFILSGYVQLEYYDLKTILTNYIYNSICIVMMILSVVKFKYEGSGSGYCWIFLMQFFFLLKIPLDLFNLIMLTPRGLTYYNPTEILLTSLIFINVFLFYCILKKHLVIREIYQIIIITMLVCICSLLRTFLFISNNLNENIFRETSKILFYLFYFFFNISCHKRMREEESVLRNNTVLKNEIQDLQRQLIQLIENCLCRGLVILKSGERVFTSNLYFENLFMDLQKRKEISLTKSVKSQTRKSIVVPSLKLSKIDTGNNTERLTESNMYLKPKESNENDSLNDKKNLNDSNKKRTPVRHFSANSLSRNFAPLRRSSNNVVRHLHLLNVIDEKEENSNIKSSRHSKKVSKDTMKSKKEGTSSRKIPSPIESNRVTSEKKNTIATRSSNNKIGVVYEVKAPSDKTVSSSDSDSEILGFSSDILEVINAFNKTKSSKKLKKKSSSNNIEINRIRLEDITDTHSLFLRKNKPKFLKNTEILTSKDLQSSSVYLKSIESFSKGNYNPPVNTNSLPNKTVIEIDQSQKNIVVNNTYSINIINSNDVKEISKTTPKTKDKYEKENKNLVPQLNECCFQEVYNEFFSNNFLEKNISPNFPYKNVNFIIKCHKSCPVISVLDSGQDHIKKVLINLNSNLESGISFSEYILKLSSVLNEIADKKFEVDVGLFKLYLPGMSPNNIEDQLFDSSDSWRRHFTIQINRITKGKERYDLVLIKNHNLSHKYENSVPLLKNLCNKKSTNQALNKNFLFLENEFENISPLNKSCVISVSNANYENSSSFIFKSKVSALLHDFKHSIIDSRIFSEYVFSKYKIPLKEEDSVFMNFMDEYYMSMIMNITNFMKDSENFLKGSTSSENSQHVDIINLIETMVKIFTRRLNWENETTPNKEAGKNIKISSIIKEEFNPKFKTLQTNKNLLISLFYNIISNSYKHTQEGEIKIEASLINYNKKILIKFTDTGSGIPEHVIRNWTRPFNVGTDSKNHKSSGLGSFIMFSIAKNLKIELPPPEPNPLGQGTVVKMIIPLNQQQNLLSVNHTINSSISVSDSQITKRPSDKPFSIPYHDKDLVGYKNSISNNSETLKFFNVLCLDDDPIVINSLIQKLKKDLLDRLHDKSAKFEFEVTYNFNSFFETLYKSIKLKKFYNFIILDQNISIDIKGIDVADYVHKTYQLFNPGFESKNLHFLFVTEQADSIRDFFDQRRIEMYNEKNVFGKTQYEALTKRLLSLVFSSRDGVII
jgi:anti-sigma regulatory factor (Ser/Thr protein kinase)